MIVLLGNREANIPIVAVPQVVIDTVGRTWLYKRQTADDIPEYFLGTSVREGGNETDDEAHARLTAQKSRAAELKAAAEAEMKALDEKLAKLPKRGEALEPTNVAPSKKEK